MSSFRVLTRRGDEGSTLVLAMIVLMVLATLSLAALARTLSVMSFVRHGQDYDAALAAADAGLSDAVYTITQSTPSAGWTETGTAGAGTYTYRTEKVNNATFRVYSKGTVGQSSHAVQALVTRDARFPFVFFSAQDLLIDGTANGPNVNLYAYNSSGPVTGELPRVGSNARVVCRGGGSGFVTHYVLGHTDCPSPYAEPHPYELADVVEPSGATQPCPAGGTFGSSAFNLQTWIATGRLSATLPVTIIDGMNGTPIVCEDDPVSFNGLITVVNPPALVYVMDQPVDLSNAIVNVVDTTLNTPGKATNFQLNVAGTGTIAVGNGNTADTLTFSGIIYAPHRSITFNAGKWFTGSIVADQLKVNGSPTLKVGYDQALSSYYETSWKVSRYREVPSAAVNL